ncbi:DEDDh family exonuclease [Frankia sp. Ag45/Mut15]|uniref:DEDDh family exonuclease n=1 Tax=Frankia umida TaxID=573489 RepID=A0ABT0K4G2_9ACTN|nr:DEDDh family exonuclease [Frankia umida]MCK9878686.1 DEDDh family exonuclease [Frankia umida]
MTTAVVEVPDFARTFQQPYAVVDVETSGLVPHRHRVLSLAVVHVAADGRVEDRWSTMLDPGCDPGPVHIHGLTRDRLAGSPTFEDVVDTLSRMLAGRVFVAHNAVFDWRMLAAEAIRCGRRLPVEWRLCTHVLAKRLGLDLPNLRLGTLARHWGITQRRAHDAADDADVLAALLPRALDLAARQYLDLPLAACGTERDDAAAAPSSYRHHDTGKRPGRNRPYPKKPGCPYLNPGRLAPDAPLVQGMRVAFTGDTVVPREELERQATAAGLHVTSSVSRLTSLIVSNDIAAGSSKARAAVTHGTPVVDEQDFTRLLVDVRTGRLRDGGTTAVERTANAPTANGPVSVPVQASADEPAPEPAAVLATGSSAEQDVAAPAVPAMVQAQLPPPAPASAPLPVPAAHSLVGRRILVLGGPHDEAATMRERIGLLGAVPAVNVTASLALAVCLNGAGLDRRMPRIRMLGVPVISADEFVHQLDTGQPGRAGDLPASTASRRAGLRLPRGGVVDLPVASAGDRWSVSATWSWDAGEVDLVAFLVGEDEQVASDEDFVFYNQPSAGEAVRLMVEGPAEQTVALDLSAVPGDVSRIVIAATLDGARTFGDVGPVEMSAVAPDGDTVLRATLDAATTERTMVLAEVYQRNRRWRFRAVGQGYDHDLARLAESYGVDVQDS